MAIGLRIFLFFLGASVIVFPFGQIDAPLKKFSLEQKIGQLFIIGFEGTEANENIENLVKNFHPGGILLLKRNIKNENQLKELIASLQKIAIEDTGIPLLISVDQEGGEVSRVEWLKEKSQKNISSREEAVSIAENQARNLKELGINLNFSPLADASYPGDFIYQRVFQKNSGSIKSLAGGMIEGYKNGGLISSLKHFPGYASISFNPEESLAFVDKMPEATQFRTEPLPETIMVSNVVYKEIDEKLPFSFSSNGINYLKKNIPGNYLIISDDLCQNSLLGMFSIEDIVSYPVNAGVDILIFSGWREEASKGFLALQNAVKNKKVSEERIDNAFSEILKLKEEYFK